MPVIFRDFASLNPQLPDGETHVYSVAIEGASRLAAFLTPDEQARSQRFRSPRARDQFVGARASLRTLLSNYLKTGPQDVPLLYADGGKPYLPDDCGLHFNLSHTDGLAVFAVDRRLVGVDVERERDVPDAEALVARFFAAREAAQFAGLPNDQRSSAFLRAWTRKESVLKALGRGVASLDCCEVTIDDVPQVVCLDGDEKAAARWELTAWQPMAGYQAAVAVELAST